MWYKVHESDICAFYIKSDFSVLFKSCKDEKAFILTEYPSSESVVDFLRLIKDHEADYIIFMNPADDVMKVHV